MKLNVIAYHSTTPQRAHHIREHGFRIPRSPTDAVTDGQVGDYFPAVFFSRRPTSDYGPVLFVVRLRGRFIAWRSRKGESLSNTLHRLIGESVRRGLCGVDSGTETVGIAVTDLRCIEDAEVPS